MTVRKLREVSLGYKSRPSSTAKWISQITLRFSRNLRSSIIKRTNVLTCYRLLFYCRALLRSITPLF
ncbi:hypothetical protein PILCRDRAFT_618235 [Piloderma croceum F 1598]|uniref:Uncharacterized protein n=1 Tax=Piloderma croceum (strain F 1598) TaxID=765440 RepID=A0A0C3AUG4_PILCF|nr:hypothetical protein PILCRDRAFT_618235 [Piloderma croceum F 1598]